MTLRGKITLASIGVVFLLTVTLAVFIGARQRQALTTQYADQAIAIANSLGSAVLPDLIAYNFFNLEPVVRVSAASRSVDYLVVHDVNGRIVAHSSEPGLVYQQPTTELGLAAAKTDTTIVQKTDATIEAATPVVHPSTGQRWGVIRVGVSTEGLEAQIREIRAIIAGLGLLVIIASWILSRAFAKGLVAHVNQLVQAMDKAAEGDLKVDIDVDSRDEIGQLADHFQDMLAKLRDRERRLRQSERLAGVGNMAAGIAHEVRNPLSAIKAYVEALPEKKARQEFIERFVERVPTSIARIEGLVSQLMELARPAEAERETHDLSAIAQETARLFEEEAGKRNVDVTVQAPQPVPAEIDRIEIERAVSNIIANALQAIGRDGRIDIAVEAVDRSPCRDVEDGSRWARISIADTGPGIPEEKLHRIFEPYYTTKRSSQGMGLGLAITHKTLVEHEGCIDVDSVPGRGATFSLYLPAA
jgi:signal transduction histidine kinase